MGLLFAQLPVAKSKKLAQGETDLSSAERSSWPLARAELWDGSPEPARANGLQPGLAGERVSTRFPPADFGAGVCAASEPTKIVKTTNSAKVFRPCVMRRVPWREIFSLGLAIEPKC